MSLLQKLLFGFCIVGIPYIRERSIDIKEITDRILDLNSVSTCWFVSCSSSIKVTLACIEMVWASTMRGTLH